MSKSRCLNVLETGGKHASILERTAVSQQPPIGHFIDLKYLKTHSKK